MFTKIFFVSGEAILNFFEDKLLKFLLVKNLCFYSNTSVLIEKNLTPGDQVLHLKYVNPYYLTFDHENIRYLKQY